MEPSTRLVICSPWRCTRRPESLRPQGSSPSPSRGSAAHAIGLSFFFYVRFPQGPARSFDQTGPLRCLRWFWIPPAARDQKPPPQDSLCGSINGRFVKSSPSRYRMSKGDKVSGRLRRFQADAHSAGHHTARLQSFKIRLAVRVRDDEFAIQDARSSDLPHASPQALKNWAAAAGSACCAGQFRRGAR